jgi:hypothetical protein
MELKYNILSIWLVLVLVAGCSIIPGKETTDPSFYVLNPYDFPQGFVVIHEDVKVNEVYGVRGFYLSMKIKKDDGSGATLQWTNIGYTISDRDAGQKNFEEIQKLVPSDFVKLDAPQIGDENYFYASPEYSDLSGNYIYFFRKGDVQTLVMVDSKGVPLDDILFLLDILDKKINK